MVDIRGRKREGRLKRGYGGWKAKYAQKQDVIEKERGSIIGREKLREEHGYSTRWVVPSKKGRKEKEGKPKRGGGIRGKGSRGI